MNTHKKASLRYYQALARMESEVKRAKTHVTMLKMLHKEFEERKLKEKTGA